jgi:dihydrofolate reductase
MSSSVLLMSMSADGYIAGPDDRPGNPGGDDFMRLHEWYLNDDGEVGRPEGEPGEIWDELNATGAVLVGRRTAEQVDYYGGDHHGVPIFVLSREPRSVPYEKVHFVSDIETAMAQAKAAAGASSSRSSA